MARQQIIPGTEREDEHPEIIEAHQALLEARRDNKAATEKAKQKQHELVALMRSRDVKVLVYLDEDTNEEIEVSLEDEPKIRTRKTGEADSEIGEGVTADPFTPGSDEHAGIVAQAERAMAAANVEFDSEGNVVVPETSAPKKPRGRKAKAAEETKTEAEAG